MDPVLSTCLNGALALILGSAFIHKARNPSHFEASLVAYGIGPAGFHAIAARSLIALEAVVTLSLIGQIFFDPLRPFGSAGAFVLLTLYSCAIAINLMRGRRDLDCGCDGPGKSRPISSMLLARNALFMMMAALTALPPVSRSLLAIDVFSIVFALGAISLLYQSLNQLGQTAQSPFSSHASHARRVS